jgi:hypothetical protein
VAQKVVSVVGIFVGIIRQLQGITYFFSDSWCANSCPSTAPGPCILVDNARDGALADPARCGRPRLFRRLALDFVGYADDVKRHSGVGLGA